MKAATVKQTIHHRWLTHTHTHRDHGRSECSFFSSSSSSSSWNKNKRRKVYRHTHTQNIFIRQTHEILFYLYFQWWWCWLHQSNSMNADRWIESNWIEFDCKSSYRVPIEFLRLSLSIDRLICCMSTTKSITNDDDLRFDSSSEKKVNFVKFIKMLIRSMNRMIMMMMMMDQVFQC